MENDLWLDQIDSTPIVEPEPRFEAPEPVVDEFMAPSKSPKWYNILTTGRMFYTEKGVPTKENPTKTINIPLSQFHGLRTSQHLQKGFADVKIVQLRAGAGGNGSILFFRDAGRAIGPPDGGDGGEGGSVFVQAVPGISSLHKLKVRYSAGDGGKGAGRHLDGPRGQDVVISVPVGTVVRWIPDTELIKDSEEGGTSSVDAEIIDGCVFLPRESGFAIKEGEFVSGNDGKVKYSAHQLKVMEKAKKKKQSTTTDKETDDQPIRSPWLFKEKDEAYHRSKDWFQDLDKKMQKYDAQVAREEQYTDVFPLEGVDLSKPSKKPLLLLQGGKGGLGNMHFLTKEIRNPRFAKPGRPALKASFMFELKLLAEFGLVGLPNSGKLTLLNALTNANSRVGHWQFTTLQPKIGTIPGADKDLKIADIPGIIEGAATCPEKPRGMGVEFLRHIERSQNLVFVISLEKSPKDDLDVLLAELQFGRDRLKGKRTLVVATKADLAPEDVFVAFRQYVKHKLNCATVPVCALKKENVQSVFRHLDAMKE